MIDYSKVGHGDILRIVGAGAPGYAALGDLVRVVARAKESITVENKHGKRVEFAFNCGAARLAPTEDKGDFSGVTPPAVDQ